MPTVSTLEINNFQQKALAALHFLEQPRLGQIGCDAGIGQAPDKGDSKWRSLIDGDLDARLQIEADGAEQLKPGRLFAARAD